MPEQPRFLPASSFTLDAFADIFTRSFEGYAYASRISAEDMARRVREDNFDLYRSTVMLIGDEPAGMAVLALRGDRAWCGGFGVMVPFRGRGLSHRLAAALLDRARQAGARTLSLEVLARNVQAIKTYTRAGLTTRRDLLVFEWRRPDGPVRPAPSRGVTVAPPDRLLEHFKALHQLPAAWQRDLPALLVCRGLRGLAVGDPGGPAAYALFQSGASGTARIVDIGARRTEDLAPLLQAIQARNARIFDVNEPADSPVVSALRSAGFVETERQHEMAIDLA